jgi:hypothetical protein
VAQILLDYLKAAKSRAAAMLRIFAQATYLSVVFTIGVVTGGIYTPEIIKYAGELSGRQDNGNKLESIKQKPTPQKRFHRLRSTV